MKVTQGTIKGGQVSLSEPIPWPEGTTVQIRPISTANGVDEDDLGIGEDEQADDPESIARWIAEFDAIPALQMAPEEEAEWQAARNAQKWRDVGRPGRPLSQGQFSGADTVPSS